MEVRYASLMSGLAVILLHEPPDEPAHHDLLLLRPGADGLDPQRRDLLTFRTGPRPDRLAVGETMEATRIGEHRNRYMEFEGDIGGGRGVVRRLASADLRWTRCDDGAFACEVDWPGGAARLRGRRRDGDDWEIERIG